MHSEQWAKDILSNQYLNTFHQLKYLSNGPIAILKIIQSKLMYLAIYNLESVIQGQE